jgi:nucleoside-diphosphate-sugar epimerase
MAQQIGAALGLAVFTTISLSAATVRLPGAAAVLHEGLAGGDAGAVARAGEALWRALPLPGAPPLTRLAFWLTSQECTIDITKARTELGYRPVISVEEGLAGLSA